MENVVCDFEYRFDPHNVASILGKSTNLSVKIHILTTDRLLKRKINNTREIFRLDEIMSAHSDELTDLFEIRYKYSERYLQELFDAYRNLGLNLKEVYKTAFGVYYDEQYFGDRPFSKLKKDILKELQIIT